MPVKVTATFRSAFGDVFNLLMVGTFTTSIIIFVNRLLTGVFDIILVLLLLFAVPFLALYVWPILTRSFEVNEDGIVYQEAFRNLVIRWDEIDSVNIEPWKKQITFWIHGKLTRIHTFGLRPKELDPVQEVFLNQIKAHGITLK